VQPVPKDQYRLAQEYRRARRAHVEALKRQRDERVQAFVDERQLELV
jgi:hypothetical protein